MLKNGWYHAKVLAKRFHLNGHTIGFHQRTQKLELHYMSPRLGLKGFKRSDSWKECYVLFETYCFDGLVESSTYQNWLCAITGH